MKTQVTLEKPMTISLAEHLERIRHISSEKRTLAARKNARKGGAPKGNQNAKRKEQK